ncbi:MAG TPA: HEAT repeat domain-containing protein [Pirellulales bacterium]|nr:HEAT repeat domain-containing protein [Pirellulales bacterium]
MRALTGHRSPLLRILLLFAAAGGCTWGSTNGVPFWGSKADKEEAAANLKKYGPIARDRISLVKEEGKYAAKGSPDDKEKVSADLARMIQTEQDPLVREEIVRTLATIPTETAANVLAAGMKDSEPKVRVAVCQAWGKRGSPVKFITEPTSHQEVVNAATLALAQALASDTNIDVRLAAARALGKVQNNPRAIGALGIALKDRDPALQVRAIASLKESSNKDFGNDVTKWQQYVDSVAPPSPQESPKAVADRPSDRPQ